jgi:hypothetical protein
MVACNIHNKKTIVDDLFKENGGVHVVSIAFYINQNE